MKLVFAFSVTALFFGSAAQAQVRVPNKWDDERRTVVIDSYIPVGCDQPTIAARDHLRSIEPEMEIYFSWTANPDPAPDTTSTINRGSYGYAWQTDAGRTPKTFTGAGLFDSYGTLIDADILMNHDLFYWPSTSDVEQRYDFFCDQGSLDQYQIDYQSAILHELGHLVGFEHRTDTTSGSCVMHEQIRRGAYARNLCNDERAVYSAAY